MKATYIEYKDTNSFSKTLLSYIDGDVSLKKFYGNQPNIDGFRAQIELKQKFSSEIRKVLSGALKSQYGELLEEGSPVSANIVALKDKKTFTVTTGHQLNIFTGPLYFIFKIVSAIKLSQELKKAFPDYHFVPVYWMATEDHDFEEINNTRVHGKKLTWNSEQHITATGRMSTKDIQDTVKQYIGMLGLSENSSKLASIVEKAYLPEKKLSEATRILAHQLFERFGLVIVDADQPKLKHFFAKYIEEDILNEQSVKNIQKTSGQLKDAGFGTQVHARDINFFYLKNEYRERIVLEGDRYVVLNQKLSFTKEELIKEINDHPERFSPNVIMRPLYQEVILPNLAYLGGGAEIVYWLQLKANFEEFNVPFPILIPRNSAIVTDDTTVGKVFRLDLTLNSIFKPLDSLKNEYVRRHTKHRLTLRDEWMDMNSIFQRLKLRAHKIDPSLGPSTEAVKARLKKAINSLEKKLLKADKRNHQEGLVQIERVKDKLFPGGYLQERSENFATLYIKYGDKLIDELLHAFDPLSFKFTILY